jgi:hypothetical protein
MQIELLDQTTGNPINGFSSVLTIGITESAGKFSKTELLITNGRSESFTFTP